MREGAAERSESFNIMIAGGNHTSAIVTLPYRGAVQLTDKSEFIHGIFVSRQPLFAV